MSDFDLPGGAAIPESERFWERVLQRVEEDSVVPVVGPDLLTVSYEGRETLLYPLVAQRLAASLHVSAGDLPPGRELQEVARRHLIRSDDLQAVYRNLRVVFRDLEPIPIPEPLLLLAKIPRFRLYVTTTFDVLTERAVDHERFDGQRQTLAFAYAPNDKQDLPPEFDRLHRPAVFHLMGRLSGTPHSYAVTREDALEFMESLQSKTEDSPGFLFDKLRRSDLLIMGAHLADWLARLFGQDTWVAERGEAPVLFVERLRGGTEVLRASGTSDFVTELYRRWTELQPEGEPEPAPSILEALASPGMQGGVVYLSCAEADKMAAEAIREALDRAGVDVVLDSDDVKLAERWEKKLRGLLRECALFVPVISKRALPAKRRFFRPEWVEALRDAGSAVPTACFVLPLVLDETSPQERALPEELGDLDWERLAGGKPTAELVKKVVELQRSCRSARFA